MKQVKGGSVDIYRHLFHMCAQWTGREGDFSPIDTFLQNSSLQNTHRNTKHTPLFLCSFHVLENSLPHYVNYLIIRIF